MPTRVLLADDHILFAQAISQLLSQRFEVVDIVADGRALRELARRLKPDVIVADVTMPIMSGLDSIRSLCTDSWVPKIVFLTMHADSDLARECLNAGASGFVTKGCNFDELIAAIDTVTADHVYLSPSVSTGIDTFKGPAALGDGLDLTSRQREILQLIAEGKTMKEIASATNLSTRTIEWHKYRMMKILRVQRSAELVRHAVRMKLVV